ncbi:MAG TPA: hypothetical protein VNQ31_04995, partial [Sphingomonadaceae bacterium]|nr:hypothetical protein [Sphingomonadaceae bacterium]
MQLAGAVRDRPRENQISRLFYFRRAIRDQRKVGQKCDLAGQTLRAANKRLDVGRNIKPRHSGRYGGGLRAL